MGWNFKSLLATVPYYRADPGGRGRPGDQESESDLQGRIQSGGRGGGSLGVRTAPPPFGEPPNFIKKEKARARVYTVF